MMNPHPLQLFEQAEHHIEALRRDAQREQVWRVAHASRNPSEPRRDRTERPTLAKREKGLWT